MSSKLEVSTDKSRLDRAKIEDVILHHTYWGGNRTPALMQAAIDGSLCFGLYQGEEQLAFARVVSDFATFAYMMDVVVFDPHKGKGYGRMLTEAMVEHGSLQTVNWLLRTEDAGGLYEKFGFERLVSPKDFMRKTADWSA